MKRGADGIWRTVGGIPVSARQQQELDSRMMTPEQDKAEALSEHEVALVKAVAEPLNAEISRLTAEVAELRQRYDERNRAAIERAGWQARATAAEQRAEALLAEALQWKNMYLVAAERYTAAEQRLEAAERALERMAGAVSWIEAPFVDENTPLNELQARVALCVADAARALSGQTEKQGGESDG